MNKHAVRALAQSLGKEDGKEDIHVCPRSTAMARYLTCVAVCAYRGGRT